MKVKELAAWAIERQSIYLKKEAGKPKPWTKDKIFQQFSFCNVYREQDRVTKWIRENWTVPNAGDPYGFFAMTMARLVNWPDSLEKIGYPKKWGTLAKAHFVATMNAPGKTYSGAYVVSTNGHAMNKAEYLAAVVLTPIWDARNTLNPEKGETLASYHKKLMKFDGLGSFMAAQVVADVKNDVKSPLTKAPDFTDWAAPGPGSKRGLNRVVDRPIDMSWPGNSWLNQMVELRKEFAKHYAGAPMPDMQDLQNCLCEFDKYERTRLGEGRPRSTYPGAA